MISLSRSLLMTAFIVVPATAQTQSPALPPLPLQVKSKVQEMIRACQAVGAQPDRSPELIHAADLTNDGIDDFVVNEGGFVCKGAASLFSGSGGSQATVFVSRGDGQASDVFSAGHGGVQIDRSTTPATALLMVGGPLCGQKKAVSRAEATFCWRPLLWNAKTRTMDFAPVAQIRPVR
ncbi:hypothetical protein [Nitrogeniibacter aestuarii]|uniref:hypothetical protein n=1 Tax=Nitrogeniibacter aestuarii TaxID=2815343 RepID=UPI001D12FBDD|nr:hypothetical protein [Nitrogeniibacter aestuarii]